jgi:hypothetical protein
MNARDLFGPQAGFAKTWVQPQSSNSAPQFAPKSRSPTGMGHESKRIGMTEQQDRLAFEREEIAARVAKFKATQEKFKREREEYYETTLEKMLATDQIAGRTRPPANSRAL